MNYQDSDTTGIRREFGPPPVGHSGHREVVTVVGEERLAVGHAGEMPQSSGGGCRKGESGRIDSAW